jgi:hypothetical protein
MDLDLEGDSKYTFFFKRNETTKEGEKIKGDQGFEEIVTRNLSVAMTPKEVCLLSFSLRNTSNRSSLFSTGSSEESNIEINSSRL